jgi:hypothetical protein
MAAGVCSYDIAILFGVAVRFFGLQSSATTEKLNDFVAPLTLVLAVTITLVGPA